MTQPHPARDNLKSSLNHSYRPQAVNIVCAGVSASPTPRNALITRPSLYWRSRGVVYDGAELENGYGFAREWEQLAEAMDPMDIGRGDAWGNGGRTQQDSIA